MACINCSSEVNGAAGISAVRNKDLTKWMEQYGPNLRLYFAPRTCRDEVDDLVQEVFTRLIARLQVRKKAITINNPQRYLLTIARNLLVNHYQIQHKRCHSFHDSLDCGIEIPDLITPERTAIGRQEYSRVVQAVLDLPPRARAAFQLHRFEDMTYQAIAEHMDVSLESVKELIHRALMRIRQVMEDKS